MIVALYARVSTDTQRESHTVESQLEALRAFAIQEEWQVEGRHIYIDDGHSGYHFDRPALDRLRDAARDGMIDVLVVHDPDRLARRYAYQVLLLEELEHAGTEVRFLHQPPPDSPEQKLLVQVQGAISEYERARIIERTRRGRLFWARQGRPVSTKVPFGYRYVRRDGEPTVEADPVAAKVVGQIFSLFAEDELSYRQIALRLTADGTHTPTGRAACWDPSSVRAIARNDTYLGTWYQNRHRQEPRPGRARPRTVERPREEWIPMTVPQLVDPELLSCAREIQMRDGPADRGGPRPLTHPDTHLLRRLVVCGVCQRKMTCLQSTSGTGYLYYWCRGPDAHRVGRSGNPCPYPTVLAPQLDEFVWADVVALLTDPDVLLQAWMEQDGGKAAESDKSVLEKEKQRLDGQLTAARTQRQRLLIAYQEGAIELGELTQRRNQLEEKSAETTRRLDRLNGEQRKHTQFDNLGHDIKAVCAALDDGLDTMSIEERMALCRRLIERVVVDGESVEIHYLFPVSSNCNRRGERDQPVFATGQTMNPRKGMFEGSAGEVLLSSNAVRLALEMVIKPPHDQGVVGTLIHQSLGAILLGTYLGLINLDLVVQPRSDHELLSSLPRPAGVPPRMVDRWRAIQEDHLQALVVRPSSDPRQELEDLLHFIHGKDLSHDIALRCWARHDATVRHMEAFVDQARLNHLAALLEKLSFERDEVLLRTRMVYFYQVGEYHLAVQDPYDRRVRGHP